MQPLPSVEAFDGVMDSSENRPSLAAEEKDKEPAPFSDAPSPVRAVLNRPWPSAIVIPPEDNPSGKYRTLVATADDIGDPISPEEIAALEDKEGDDAGTRFYKLAARADVVMRNYIHEHGSLYMDEDGKYMIDNSAQVEEIRCKHVTAEEMEAKVVKQVITRKQTYLSELALANFNKRKKVKFELCETLLSRLFYESSRIFTHLNFIAKRKDKKKLFFAEIEDCGQGRGEILKVRSCVPLDSLCEGGYYYYCDDPRLGCRKGFDFTRCYGCSEFLKHPVDGSTYSGGHDHRRRNYIV